MELDPNNYRKKNPGVSRLAFQRLIERVETLEKQIGELSKEPESAEDIILETESKVKEDA